jgi:hypothetical protein
LNRSWKETVPVLDRFAQVVDAANYASLPDEWFLGVSDVVNSTSAISSGRYKAVNLAGAATISAVSNALQGDLPFFVFGGDGARFAVAPEQAANAKDALSRVAGWAKRDVGLELRVGMVGVGEIRAAGFDVSAAFWRASENVHYAMFTGGGFDWAEDELKSGRLAIGDGVDDREPDLTGLSCQWGPIRSSQGRIVSLIVKRAPNASRSQFSDAVRNVVAFLEGADAASPVADSGPNVRWPSESLVLQAAVVQGERSLWRRWLRVVVPTMLFWVIFKLGIRLGRFDPKRYRREIAANTDFRKFDDALMMTVDCDLETISQLRMLLNAAVDEGAIRYGLHVQNEALMTCVVPSLLDSGHMHFIDGADGGYAIAARQLRD